MVMSQSHPNPDWFQGYDFLALLVTVLALELTRLVSSRSPRLSPRRVGLISACEFLLVAGIMFEAAAIQSDLHPDDYSFVDNLSEPFRKPVERQLAAMPGEHLVLVRYSKDHNSGEEYVYNEADIDHAKTVWAREIPGMDLRPLLSYFRNRDVWLYEPDVDDGSVSPYSPPDSAR
jgi:hypothetical protein